MPLFIDVLKEKYNVKTKFDKDELKDSKISEKNFENQIKKSGLFIGTKASQTYQKNHLQHIVNHTLNKNTNESLSNLIKESYLFFENQNEKSVVYRKNVKTPQGTNKLSFPHSAVAKTISKTTPNKPKDGIGVPTIFNRVGLYKRHVQDLKTIPKLFQNNQNNQNNQ